MPSVYFREFFSEFHAALLEIGIQILYFFASSFFLRRHDFAVSAAGVLLFDIYILHADAKRFHFTTAMFRQTRMPRYRGDTG